MEKTSQQWKEIVDRCKSLFDKKMEDYGPSWRVLRPTSLTDQIFIKANRLRSIEDKGKQMVEDDTEGEYIGIINYCIITLIQIELKDDSDIDLDAKKASELYAKHAKITHDLLMKKNHDYGEAWRSMRPSSFTDLILQKLIRVKQIEDNLGKTLISEGIGANYQDIINYAIFALIRKNE